SFGSDKTAALVLQTFGGGRSARLRDGPGPTLTTRRSKRLGTRSRLAHHAPGLGRRILRSRKLCSGGGAALASESFTGATLHPVACFSWTNLILALPNALVCT